jgi:hypothetical protein
MPGLGDTDPANLSAQARAELGLRRQLEQHRCVPPPPSNGGSAGYPVWYRREQLQKWNEGGPTDVSRASLYHWADHPHPFRQNGGSARTTIVGVDMIHLVTFLIAHPDSTQDEMATFVYNKGGALYSKQRISKRLDDLKITKKKASIQAFQALSAEVQFWVFTHWNCPPPLGILEVRRRKLINIDKFGAMLERCNHTSGWALKVFCIRKDGYYGHGKKITVLFAIKPGDPALAPHVYGSVERPWRWIRCLRSKGTTTNVFRDFCELICLDIEMNGIDGMDDH